MKHIAIGHAYVKAPLIKWRVWESEEAFDEEVRKLFATRTFTTKTELFETFTKELGALSYYHDDFCNNSMPLVHAISVLILVKDSSTGSTMYIKRIEIGYPGPQILRIL